MVITSMDVGLVSSLLILQTCRTLILEAYSEPYQTTKMELFQKIVSEF